MSEEESREEIEQIVNNNEEIKEEIVKEEIVKEEVKEEIKEEVKPKAKTRAKAKAKVKIVKESVVEVVEPIVEEKPVKVDKLKQIVKCPDCGLEMTQHTLKYIHKRRGFCKADIKTETVKPEVKAPAPEPEQPKTKITEDIVNNYIKENPDVISNYLRNERVLKAQKNK